MEQYIIKGGSPLAGEVEITGAKNAALAILAASTMTDETVTIENMPDEADTNVLLGTMNDIGVFSHRVARHTVRVNAHLPRRGFGRRDDQHHDGRNPGIRSDDH